jgi:energy-coupling factor transport system permease protein
VVSTVREAQRSRGLDLDTGGPISKARKHLPLLVPVFISSIRRSDDMALALESKGFGRSNPKTYLKDYEFGLRDIILLLLVTGLIVLLGWLRKQGIGGV